MLMILSFKQFLSESRSAPLYHATPYGNAANILKNGFDAKTFQTIYKGKGQHSWGRYGVSFARSMKAAQWYMKTEHQDDLFVIFEVDQQKIANKYRIEPVDYFGTQALIGNPDYEHINNRNRRKETEEFVTINRKWSDIKSDYVGSLPPTIIRAIYYFQITRPTAWETEYHEHIEQLKAKYPRYNWVQIKR